jgi:hypothetical protein
MTLSCIIFWACTTTSIGIDQAPNLYLSTAKTVNPFAMWGQLAKLTTHNAEQFCEKQDRQMRQISIDMLGVRYRAREANVYFECAPRWRVR